MLLDAINTGNFNAVQSLLANGASPNPLWDHKSALQEHCDLLRDLSMWDDSVSEEENLASATAQMVPPPQRPYFLQIPLFCAALQGNLPMVQALLNAGADVHQIDAQQNTALFFATSLGVAQELMQRGLDLEAHNEYEWPPLVNAIMEGDLLRVTLFVEAGANPNATHDRGCTPLMCAVGCAERNVQIIRALLDAGADPHAVSDLGYNAFHAAIDVNGAEANAEPSVRAVFSLLSELEIDMEAVNFQGHTPLMRAKCFGNPIDVQVLLELGAKSE